MAAKTMKRIVIAAILLIVIAAAACIALVTCSTGTPLESARSSVLNTVIDTSGVKDRIEAGLKNRASSLAEEYGIPEEILDAGIDMLAIDKWKVTNAPSDAQVKKTVEIDLDGSPVQITTYDDDSIVSIKGEGKLNTFGQTITFEVPESAQGLANLLPYYDAAEEVGALDAINSLIHSSE